MNGLIIEETAYYKAGGNPKYISHGICDEPDCKSAYLTHALSCTKEEAESMLEEILKEK